MPIFPARAMTNHLPRRQDAGVVLVVDDERHIVDLLTDLLEDEGYTVLRAIDGIDALEQIEQQTPDVVVADVMMPRLDGIRLFGIINDRYTDLPVILMSAAVRPRLKEARFVAKPFDIDEMLTLIESAIHAH